MNNPPSRDPRLELMRRLLKRDTPSAKLAGPRSAGNSDTSTPTWNLPDGEEGEVLTLVDVDGALIALFRPGGSGTFGPHYLYSLFPDDSTATDPDWLIFEGAIMRMEF